MTCSYILTGVIGEKEIEYSTILNGALEVVSTTPLVPLSLLCTDTRECAEAEAWFTGLPWLSEVRIVNNKFYDPIISHATPKNFGFELVCKFWG